MFHNNFLNLYPNEVNFFIYILVDAFSEKKLHIFILIERSILQRKIKKSIFIELLTLKYGSSLFKVFGKHNI